MKKKFAMILALVLALASVAAFAEGSALEAFRQLTGQDTTLAQDEQAPVTFKTSEDYLDEIMAGAYATPAADQAAAASLAPALSNLSAITMQDIASYAAGHALSVAQVRNAYYRALANVLRAEILVNPASEERYKNVQVILSLFLDTDDGDAAAEAEREAIRLSMTRETAQSIASDYNLPADFVEFIIMDDDWDDDDWENDDDWGEAWNDDATAGLEQGNRDDAQSTRVAELQTRLIALGYLSGKADGIFGQRTEAALREFQLANGIAPTGVYDADDAERLFAANAVARWDYVEDFYDTDDDDYYDDLYDDTDDDDVYYDDTDDDDVYYDDTNDDDVYYDDTDDDDSYSGGSYDDTDDDGSYDGYDDTDDDNRPAATPQPDYDDTDDDDSYDDYDDTDDDDRAEPQPEPQPEPKPEPQPDYDDTDDDDGYDDDDYDDTDDDDD